MKTIDYLDVTLIEPKFKHSEIFKRFDSLQPGESFVIHNDHDPKPLYFQLIAERGKVFNWEYLEENDFWQVKISKLLPGEASTIGELVAKDFRKAEIFKKFGIDFCCGGKKTVFEACVEKGIDPKELGHELNLLNNIRTDEKLDFENWDAGFLADYIVNIHHKYVQQSIPIIYAYAQKVSEKHGKSHPELTEIFHHFAIVSWELESHMEKEEKILFPYIKQMELAISQGHSLPDPHFGTVDNPIHMMEMEHEQVGNEMALIKELTNNYVFPENACATYQTFYLKMQEFEQDLHKHIHLENNILFKKAKDLELKINKQ